MTRRHLPQDLLRDLTFPGAPPDLRERCLKAASDTSPVEPKTELWSLLWESRPLRLAWATTVTILLLGNLAVTFTPRFPASPSDGSPFLVAGILPEGELADLVDFVPLRSDRLPMVGTNQDHQKIYDDFNPERS